MSIFNFKSKNKSLSGGLKSSKIKKLAKKSKESVIISLDNRRKGLKLYKVGNYVYAPVPQQNKRHPVYFKVTNMTFVTLLNSNNENEESYNISIEYQKNGGNRFYSYDNCDNKTKNSIYEHLGEFVNIQTRNKEDLNAKEIKQETLVPLKELKQKPLKELAQETISQKEIKSYQPSKSKVHIETTKIEPYSRPTKRVKFDSKHIFTGENSRNVLVSAVDRIAARREMESMNDSNNVVLEEKKELYNIDNKLNNYSRIDIKSNPINEEAESKKYFERIKFAKENTSLKDSKIKNGKNISKDELKKLSQEEIDDILFFE